MCPREEIDNLLRRCDVRKRCARKVVVANEIEINLKMLYLLMENRIASNLDGIPIITVTRSRSHDRTTLVCQQSSKPHDLPRSGRHGPILSLNSRKSNTLMLLALLGDKIIPRKM